MPNTKFEVRLSAIMVTYLLDLAKIGYGKDKSAVARRFIENGVTHALEMKVIATRSAGDSKGADEETQREGD